MCFFFGQRKETVEWNEFRDDVLFYKWKNNEIKRGSRLVIRPGQKAIFYAGGAIGGVFEKAGTYDIDSEILPVLSTVQGFMDFRRDSGLRAEVYFVNAKELTMKWGTRQRIMIPTAEVPSGIPVGMNGTLTVEFRDYLTFIEKVAGVKGTYSLGEVRERILGELDGVVAETILAGQSSVGLNALVSIQANSRTWGKKLAEELDKELFDIGLGVRDVNIVSVNYPESVQEMAEKLAGQSFIQDTAKYTAVAMADGMAKGGADVASAGVQMALGAQLAQQMTGGAAPAADRFCPNCRKMVAGNFCPDCGTQTV